MAKMYRIQYKDLRNNKTITYCGGLQFTKRQANDEIKLLRQEQKELDKPTREHFIKVKV